MKALLVLLGYIIVMWAIFAVKFIYKCTNLWYWFCKSSKANGKDVDDFDYNYHAQRNLIDFKCRIQDIYSSIGLNRIPYEWLYVVIAIAIGPMVGIGTIDILIDGLKHDMEVFLY